MTSCSVRSEFVATRVACLLFRRVYSKVKLGNKNVLKVDFLEIIE